MDRQADGDERLERAPEGGEVDLRVEAADDPARAQRAHSREQIESFTEHVRTLAGVLSIFHVTGQTDYLLWVAAADAHDLREFVVEHLASDPAVSHAETSLIYEQRRGPGVFGADPA